MAHSLPTHVFSNVQARTLHVFGICFFFFSWRSVSLIHQVQCTYVDAFELQQPNDVKFKFSLLSRILPSWLSTRIHNFSEEYVVFGQLRRWFASLACCVVIWTTRISTWWFPRAKGTAWTRRGTSYESEFIWNIENITIEIQASEFLKTYHLLVMFLSISW